MIRIVDSSGWLEYLADGPNADRFAVAIEDTEQLVVPTISIYEVFKRVLQQRGEGDALRAVAVMHQATVVDLTAELALTGAKLSVELGIPMADALILATARERGARLLTQDRDFEDVQDVDYFPKQT